MEHFFHFFGGGCGEHMVWPWIGGLASSGYGVYMVRGWIMNRGVGVKDNSRK